MALKAIKTLTAAALLASATAATAATAPFNLVSGVTSPNVDVSLTLQESTVPGYDYDFVINNSSLMGIVTGVYFEVDWASLLEGTGTPSGPASFVVDSVNPDVPEWDGSLASHTTAVTRVRESLGPRRGFVDVFLDNLADGIQEGESQTFSFNTDSDLTSLQDLQSVLGTDGFGVAIRVQGLTEDEQAAGFGVAEDRPQELLVVQSLTLGEGDRIDDNVEVTAAPSPTAAVAGLAFMGLASLRRRRK